ncbi:MAG: PstS family phosphate ABC transporter substrate-binding protein [Proteobacteria bacterium]|nr:PstS family phosphate ABC transporter substrate-binding protein [Pseudomonadota bacterium]
MIKTFTHKLAFAALAAAVIFPAYAAEARDQIRAVGSSTVYPFVTAAAEQFGRAGKFKTPIVESTGTGGGFKLFCEGVGEAYPDIANASRPIKDSEKEACAKAGVKNIEEVKIGYDGIVFANSTKAPHMTIDKKHLFLALARKVPKDGKLIDNPYKTWSDIDSKLPANPIEVYGPPPTSGTRDAFAELVMEKGCEAFPEFKAAFSDEKELKKQCSLIREDGKYIESGENDNLIIQKLVGNPNAFGIFGFSFLEQNANQVQGSHVDGVQPTFENIADASYSISRSLYIYVKLDNVAVVPGIKEFAQEVTSEKAMGDTGYLVQKGLIPLKKAERETVRAALK